MTNDGRAAQVTWSTEYPWQRTVSLAVLTFDLPLTEALDRRILCRAKLNAVTGYISCKQVLHFYFAGQYLYDHGFEVGNESMRVFGHLCAHIG